MNLPFDAESTESYRMADECVGALVSIEKDIENSNNMPLLL